MLTVSAIFGSMIALPFALWRIILGQGFASIGFAPLVFGYLLAILGLASSAFATSYVGFNNAVSAGILRESERWSIIPNWTIYFATGAPILVLPILGLVCVPVSAMLLRKQCLSHSRIAVTLLVIWLTIALFGWCFPSNLWHRTNPLESLGMWLTSVCFEIAAIGLPFFYGIYLVIRWRARAEALTHP